MAMRRGTGGGKRCSQGERSYCPSSLLMERARTYEAAAQVQRTRVHDKVNHFSSFLPAQRRRWGFMMIAMDVVYDTDGNAKVRRAEDGRREDELTLRTSRSSTSTLVRTSTMM
eukprot:747424-Hanusia_phi.AAC.5